jgi:hypothetical protein
MADCRSLTTHSAFRNPNLGKEVIMPRRERDREIARRRKRKKESRKLRKKGLSGPPVGAVKESEKKKPEKVPEKEIPQERVEKLSSEG